MITPLQVSNHAERIKKIETILEDHGLPCPLSFLYNKTNINYTILKDILVEVLGYKVIKNTSEIKRKVLVIVK